MKMDHKKLISWLLCLVLVLSMVACAPSEQPTEPTGSTQLEETDPSGATEPLGTEPTVTDPSVTDPSVTDPSVTDPSVTDPSVTDPSVTDPSVTDPSVTDPSVTDPTVTAPTVTDPTVTVPPVTTPVVVPTPTTPKPTTPKPTEPKPTDPKPTEPAPTEPAPTEPDDGLLDIDTERLPCSQTELYNMIFDPNRKVDVDIRMDETELQKIQDDYDHYESFDSQSPIYRMADVVITIDGVSYLIREVGVRMKGNTSRTSFYDSAKGGIYNAIHLKLDFQQTFDDEAYYGSSAKVWSDKDLRKARKDRTFATLEELELRWNKCFDTTYLKESYAFELFRSQGIYAPLTNLCSLDWSDVHMGVYVMVEPVDEVFLQKRLPSKDLGGDLYKCSWSPLSAFKSVGVEDEDAGKFYAYDLKTNKKTSEHQALKSLIVQLNSTVVDRQTLEDVVDMDYFVKYAAVSWFLGNPDDFRNNYNNFYIYFLKSSGKAIFIPTDQDRCLGVTTDYDPSGNGMTRDDPFSTQRQDTSKTQENPLFNYAVTRGSLFVEEYVDALTAVSKDPLLKPSTFQSWFDRAQRLYKNDAVPDKSLVNASKQDLRFDAQTSGSIGSGKNLSFKTYIEAKQASFKDYIDAGYADPQFQTAIPKDFYITTSLNDWSVEEDYRMTWENGTYTYTITCSKSAGMKIYHKTSLSWLGAGYVDNDASKLDNRITLSPGTYRIVYDPYAGKITISQI